MPTGRPIGISAGRNIALNLQPYGLTIMKKFVTYDGTRW
jgi:hypothetical protein